MMLCDTLLINPRRLNTEIEGTKIAPRDYINSSISMCTYNSKIIRS